MLVPLGTLLVSRLLATYGLPLMPLASIEFIAVCTPDGIVFADGWLVVAGACVIGLAAEFGVVEGAIVLPSIGCVLGSENPVEVESDDAIDSSAWFVLVVALR